MSDSSHCPRLRDVQRYLDGEYSGGDFEPHLAVCPACRAAMEDFVTLGALLRAACDDAPAPDLTAHFVRLAGERREQASRRIAWGLLAAASLLFVSSVLFAAYTESGRAVTSGRIVAQWERNVVWSAPPEDESGEAAAPYTLYAIHLPLEGRGVPYDE